MNAPRFSSTPLPSEKPPLEWMPWPYGPVEVSRSCRSVQAASPLFNGVHRHEIIAQAAYFRAKHRGFAPGHELEDWLVAEAEVDGTPGIGLGL